MATGSILLIDGLESSREASIDLLTKVGYVVEAAGSKDGGLELLRRSAPALVVADLTLLGIGGVEELMVTSRDEGIGRIPFIGIASRADPVGVTSALDAGASDVLLRPVEPTMLLSAVRLVLPDASMESEAVRRLWFRQPLWEPVDGFEGAYVMDVSERGLGLDLKAPIDPGVNVVLLASIWSEIGIDPPIGKVVYCRPVGAEDFARYRAGVIFVGLDAEGQRRLRSWLYRVQAKRAYRAP